MFVLSPEAGRGSVAVGLLLAGLSYGAGLGRVAVGGVGSGGDRRAGPESGPLPHQEAVPGICHYMGTLQCLTCPFLDKVPVGICNLDCATCTLKCPCRRIGGLSEYERSLGPEQGIAQERAQARRDQREYRRRRWARMSPEERKVQRKRWPGGQEEAV